MTKRTTVPSIIRAGRVNAVQSEEMHLPEPEKRPTISYTLQVLVPYLESPSEKAVFEYNQIKEGQETIKLLDEEDRILQQKLKAFA